MSVTLAMAKAAAQAFIRPYLGWDYGQLRGGWMFKWGDGYRAAIGPAGGWDGCRPKRGADALMVTMVGDEECCFEFSLRRLYDELRGDRPEQLGLFDGEAGAA